jgi:hypothetical protein
MASRRSSLPMHVARLLPAVIALGSLPAAAWLQMRPAPDPVTQGTPAQEPLALVFPPWWSAARAMLAAAPAGAIVRFGAWPGIVIIQPEPDAEPPAATGAWAVLDPRQLGGCGRGSSPETSHEP